MKQHRKDGNLFVVPCGRPIQASCPKELEKKMKNRASALEARKRAKMKEEELEKRLLQLETENEIQQTINRRLKALIEKFSPRYLIKSSRRIMKDKRKSRPDSQSHVHGPATGHGVF